MNLESRVYARLNCRFLQQRRAQPDHGDEFQYCLYGDCGMLHRGAVTLRTARVLAKEIHAETPFSAMMRAIARAKPVNFELLIGTAFLD
jgi:hypothetical protein